MNDILIRIPNWVGDAVMATCFLRALRKGRPEARITVVLRPKLQEVLHGLPYIDAFIPLRSESLGESIKLARKWRGCFDTAFILPNSLRSAVFPWFSRARERVGYTGQFRGPLLTVRLSPPRGEGGRRLPEPMPHYWRRLLDRFEIPWRGDYPELAVDSTTREKAEKAAAELGIRPGERLIGLSPGAAFGPSKLWLPERFRDVAASLYHKLGLRSILFLAPGEEAIGESIMRGRRTPIISTAENILSLELLKAFMAWCDLLITTDSGTRHIGVAFDVLLIIVLAAPTTDTVLGLLG